MGKNLRKIHIIGFPKCGSTSLRHYLRLRYKDRDVASFPGMSLYSPQWEKVCGSRAEQPDTTSVIVTRDPVPRMWSAYFWSQRFLTKREDHPTFKEFMHQKKKDGVQVTSGLNDPIECCDYEKYIKKSYQFCTPIVVRFEDLIKLPNFPHLVPTNEVLKQQTHGRGYDWLTPITKEIRKLIEDELKKSGIPEYSKAKYHTQWTL